MKRTIVIIIMLVGLTFSLFSIDIMGSGQARPSEQITASVSGRYGNDAWIGFFRTSNPDDSYFSWSYLRDLKGRPFTVTAPREYGTYEFRLFKDGGYNRIETSQTIEVVPYQPVFDISPRDMRPGTRVNVRISGAPTTQDAWIGFFRVSDPDDSYFAWSYLRDLQNNTFSVTVPQNERGPFDFRIFLDSGFFVVGKSSDQPQRQPQAERPAPAKVEEAGAAVAGDGLEGIWTRSATIRKGRDVQELSDVDMRFTADARGGYNLESLDPNQEYKSEFTVTQYEKSGRQVLQIDQRSSNGYTAQMNLMKQSDTEYFGSWKDSRGNRGDFKLVRKPGAAAERPSQENKPHADALPDPTGLWVRTATIQKGNSVQRLDGVDIRMTRQGDGSILFEYLGEMEYASEFNIDYRMQGSKAIMKIDQRSSNGYTAEIQLQMENDSRFAGTWSDSRRNRGEYFLERKPAEQPVARKTEETPVVRQEEARPVAPSTISTVYLLASGDWEFFDGFPAGRGAGDGHTFYRFDVGGVLLMHGYDSSETYPVVEAGSWKLEGDTLIFDLTWGDEIIWQPVDLTSFEAKVSMGGPTFTHRLNHVLAEDGR
jgi:hypothetical protein